MHINTQYIHLETDSNGVATLTLNRAEKCNALNLSFVQNFIEILQTIAHSDSIKTVMIKAKGRVFCAGLDLDLLNRMNDPQTIEEFSKTFAELLKLLYEFNKPTLAKIKAPVLGGGVGIVACCDIVITSKNVYFQLPELSIGIIPALISPYLISAIGIRAFRAYSLSGLHFSAKKAKQMGLVHTNVHTFQLRKKTKALTYTLSQQNPYGVKNLKQMSRLTLTPDEQKDLIALFKSSVKEHLTSLETA